MSGSIVSSTDPFDDGSLASKYLCDGSTYDIVRETNAIKDGTTYTTTAAFGSNGVNFNNTSGGYWSGVGVWGQSFSVSVFAALVQSTANDQHIISTMPTSGADNYFTLEYNGTAESLILRVVSSIDSGVIEYDIPSIENRYYHIVVTQNDTRTKVYLDKVLVINLNKSCDDDPLNYSVTYGRKHAAQTENFFGKIDQMEIYNKSLSIQEVEILYNQRIDITGSIAVSFNSVIEPEPSFNASASTELSLGSAVIANGTYYTAAEAQLTSTSALRTVERLLADLVILSTASINIDGVKAHTGIIDIESDTHFAPNISYVCYIPTAIIVPFVYSASPCEG